MRYKDEQALLLSVLQANPYFGDNVEHLEHIEPAIKNDEQIFEVTYSGPLGSDTVKVTMLDVLLHIANHGNRDHE